MLGLGKNVINAPWKKSLGGVIFLWGIQTMIASLEVSLNYTELWKKYRVHLNYTKCKVHLDCKYLYAIVHLKTSGSGAKNVTDDTNNQ